MRMWIAWLTVALWAGAVAAGCVGTYAYWRDDFDPRRRWR